MTSNMPRVMCLLTNSSVRDFEVTMMKIVGIKEVFLPKIYPRSKSVESTSIDYSQDVSLTIPANELAVLNMVDWYTSPGKDAWNIANKYFEAIIFIGNEYLIFKDITSNFRGAIILRAYGTPKAFTYTDTLYKISNGLLFGQLARIGSRFFLAETNRYLDPGENDILKRRHIYLPTGIPENNAQNNWIGHCKKVYFICPDIELNTTNKNTYKTFVRDFYNFEYLIAGAQILPVSSPKVLAGTAATEHTTHFREFRVMFYNSTERDYLDRHPFEAILVGIPLVFMAGGVLDEIGGVDQPGRCNSIEEARKKIRRILDDDLELICNIKEHQSRLINAMRPESCRQAWKCGLERILGEMARINGTLRPAAVATPRKKIAVIVPIGYRGGSLRGAKMLAHALWEGSRQAKEDVDVVLAHLDEPSTYPDEEFDDLHPSISRRAFQWVHLDAAAAHRAMSYAGYSWEPTEQHYLAPNDNMQQFMDCDLWVIVSDRLTAPLLPIRPYCCMVYDYLQRYERILPAGADRPFLDAARLAQRVMVTTKFTEQDALQYAGICPKQIARVPMLAPAFLPISSIKHPTGAEHYFLWTTNAAPHKNHLNAILALKEYYEILDGQLQCRVTGVNTKNILKSKQSHLMPIVDIVENSPALRNKIDWLGELPDKSYQAQLAGAGFLWHAGRIDNGTFSVVEAAHFGVPALSSDYPAMREINTQFNLNLTWMDPNRPKSMAVQLKWIEKNTEAARSALPGKDVLQRQAIEELAMDYWKVVRECL